MVELIAAGGLVWTIATPGVATTSNRQLTLEDRRLTLDDCRLSVDERESTEGDRQPATAGEEKCAAVDGGAAPDFEPRLSSLAPRLSNLEPRTSNRDPAPRSPALTAMYVTFGALQVADIHSTSRALSNGGVEANPAMRAVVGNRAAFIAVKAAGGATTILVSEKLRKKHPVAAFVLMASLNSFLATVVARNYRVH